MILYEEFKYISTKLKPQKSCWAEELCYFRYMFNYILLHNSPCRTKVDFTALFSYMANNNISHCQLVEYST